MIKSSNHFSNIVLKVFLNFLQKYILDFFYKQLKKFLIQFA